MVADTLVREVFDDDHTFGPSVNDGDTDELILRKENVSPVLLARHSGVVSGARIRSIGQVLPN